MVIAGGVVAVGSGCGAFTAGKSQRELPSMFSVRPQTLGRLSSL